MHTTTYIININFNIFNNSNQVPENKFGIKEDTRSELRKSTYCGIASVMSTIRST